MKYKLSIGILVLLVSTIMLMSNALASAGPWIWINQVTLSNIDSNPSQDPENSGFGMMQAVVWEEWNGADWDIWLKFNPLNGVPGVWAFPLIHPATTGVDEINPAVTVTNLNPITGATEIHVVYQRDNPVVPNTWDICHVWTFNMGMFWIGPVILDTVVNNNARNPAIVYTEDQAVPGPSFGMLIQIVWSEFNPGTGFYEIYYDAFYQDPNLMPRGYVGPTLIRASPGGHCWLPEIASVDETRNPLAYDFPFAVVWQEPDPIVPNMNIWYVAGITTTSPGGPITVLVPGTLGQLNIPNNQGDSYQPDIAATQDYIGADETYYFHVVWVYHKMARPPPFTFQIDTCYFAGANPTPPAAAFIMTAPAQGPVNAYLDNPTVASKLLQIPPPTIFETWMAWEDATNPLATNPDIWGRVGTYTVGAPPFIYTMGAPLRVPYAPGAGSTEFNPELWNRNDVTGLQPLTHLVFDQSIQGAAREVIYIDP